jgi:hypothetical protein
VPPGGPHCDKPVPYVGPHREALAGNYGFKFLLVLKHLESIGSDHFCFGVARVLAAWSCFSLYPSFHGRRTEPLVKVCGVGWRLSHFLERVAQLFHQNERPLLSIFRYLGQLASPVVRDM